MCDSSFPLLSQLLFHSDNNAHALEMMLAKKMQDVIRMPGAVSLPEENEELRKKNEQLEKINA
jgi:hypothetical protein